jgi:tetratricopeptide (TPR) repeat protein
VEVDVDAVESALRCLYWVVALAAVLAVLLAINTGICLFEFWERRRGCGSPSNRLYQKVSVLLGREKYDEALQLVEDLLRKKPSDSPALWLKGLANFKMGRWDACLQALRDLTAADPGWKERAQPYIDAAQKAIAPVRSPVAGDERK